MEIACNQYRELSNEEKKGNRVQKKLLLEYNWRIQSNTKRYNKEKINLKNKLETFGSVKGI